MTDVAEVEQPVVCVQQTQDPNIMVYHTRFEMVDKTEEGWRGDTEGLGEFGKLFLEIRGVQHVRVTPYMIFIMKGVAFQWNEVQSKVLDILTTFASPENSRAYKFGADGEAVEI